MKRPSTAIVGSGKLATALAKRFLAQQWPVQWILSRNQESGQMLASTCGASYSTLEQLPLEWKVDVVLLCVPDDQLGFLAGQLRPHCEVLVHHSGTVEMAVLEGAQAAVLWPVMSFSHQLVLNWPEIPLLWEAGNDAAAQVVLDMAKALGGPVLAAGGADRRRMHLAAVFANNFTNACITIAQQLAEQAQCPAEILNPLIRQTLTQALEAPAYLQQTGPAQRGDISTMESHLRMLQHHPELANCYRALSAFIAHQEKKI